MKKEVTLFSIFLFLIFASLFVVAQSEDIVCEEGDDDCKIDKAYSCLQEKIDDKTCSKLSSEERVFSLLAAGECRSEVSADSKFKSNSNVKFTAQAILALGGDNDAEEWLISRNRSTTNLDWFLQIDTSDSGELKCDVDFSSSGTELVTIQEDKTVSGGGSCLDASNAGLGLGSNYWFEIDSDCYGEEIDISCDKSFTTNLLYKGDSDTIYVSEDTSSASGGGNTDEKVKSFCFGQGGSCNYEASLWATLVLNALNYDMTPYLPYLVTNIEGNEDFIPEAFLFILTGEFKTELLLKQKQNKWWKESGDKFYDTALVLYAFQFEDSLEKTDSLRYLLDDAQEDNGCWSNSQNVIRNTAFLLYSIEPRGGSISTPGSVDCEDSGYDCRSSVSCTQGGGNALGGYSCSGVFVCCDQAVVLDTCSEQGGDICSSGQSCIGGVIVDASDTSSCCVSGTCGTSSTGSEVSECESIGGECRINSCSEGEEESFEECKFSTDICCIEKSGENVSSVWIWILLILIILSVLGIVFRKKLSPIWFRLKSKFGKGFKPGPGGPRPGGPRPPGAGVARGFPRRIIPSRRPPLRRPPAPRQPGELKDVLKKLKSMGT